MVNLKKKSTAFIIGLGLFSLLAFGFAGFLGLGELYRMTENRNFAELRKKSELNCETMPYHCAARDRDAAKLRELSASGADINARDNWGSTALIYTASWAIEMVEPLLELGCDVQAVNEYGDDAAAVVLRQRNFELARKLFAAGADINAKVGAGPKRNTRFGEAVIAKDLELIRFFLAQKIDLSVVDDYGYNGCERAAMYGLSDQVPECQKKN